MRAVTTHGASLLVTRAGDHGVLDAGGLRPALHHQAAVGDEGHVRRGRVGPEREHALGRRRQRAEFVGRRLDLAVHFPEAGAGHPFVGDAVIFEHAAIDRRHADDVDVGEVGERGDRVLVHGDDDDTVLLLNLHRRASEINCRDRAGDVGAVVLERERVLGGDDDVALGRLADVEAVELQAEDARGELRRAVPEADRIVGLRRVLVMEIGAGLLQLHELADMGVAEACTSARPCSWKSATVTSSSRLRNSIIVSVGSTTRKWLAYAVEGHRPIDHADERIVEHQRARRPGRAVPDQRVVGGRRADRDVGQIGELYGRGVTSSTNCALVPFHLKT